MSRTLTVPPPPTKMRIDPVRLVRSHQAEVWRYLRLLGCSPDEADDLTQETFLAVLRAGAVDDRGSRAAAGYLRRVARSRFVDRRRAERRSVPLDPEVVEAVWARTAARSTGGADAWLTALRGCVAGLPARSRAVVELFYRQRLGRRDIAARLGLRENGVKTLLQRVRATLRACIERRLHGRDA